LISAETLVNRILSLPLRMTKLFTSSPLFQINTYSLGHLRSLRDYELGPIQRDEALLLYALVKTIDPKTIIEFGFYEGHSAINFLKAMSLDARLYSYDISDDSKRLAAKIHDRRLKFVFKSQADFEPSDVDYRLVDLAFFDASHDFLLNVMTLERLKDSLNERGLIIVHDTGAWYGDLKGLQTPEGHFVDDSISGGYIHQPGERRFVNYIRESMKDFDQIHLHSTSKFRHGLTILQRNLAPLSV
jgi:hypothetical protein